MEGKSLVGSVVLALGIVTGFSALGYFFECGMVKSRATDRYITVKGLDQEFVKANLGVWEVDYREVGDNLVDVNQRVATDQQKVINFLHAKGFSDTELELRPTKVTDTLANPYSSNQSSQVISNRYIVYGGVRIRTNNVDQIQKSTQETSALINEGVPLSFDTSDYSSDLSPNPSYFYTDLDQIRPKMLTLSTESAHAIAEQFANNTGNKIVGIRRASQGVFQLMSRDSNDADNSMREASSIYKKVRLVTTIDYVFKKNKND